MEWLVSLLEGPSCRGVILRIDLGRDDANQSHFFLLRTSRRSQLKRQHQSNVLKLEENLRRCQQVLDQVCSTLAPGNRRGHSSGDQHQHSSLRSTFGRDTLFPQKQILAFYRILPLELTVFAESYRKQSLLIIISIKMSVAQNLTPEE